MRNRVGISSHNNWSFAEKRLETFYQTCPVSIYPYKDSVTILFTIPFLVDCFWHDKLTLYQFVQVPVPHANHIAFVYDIDSAGIAVTQDHRYCGEERRHKWRAVEEEEASTSGPLQRGLLTWGIAAALLR